MSGNRSWHALLTALFLAPAALAPLAACRGEDDLGKQLAAQVTIHRDEWGVPHIEGPTDASVSFGFAYCQAQDYFWQIEDTYAASLGRYAELYGDAAVELGPAQPRLRNPQVVAGRLRPARGPDAGRLRRLRGGAQSLPGQPSGSEAAADHPLRALERAGLRAPRPARFHVRQDPRLEGQGPRDAWKRFAPPPARTSGPSAPAAPERHADAVRQSAPAVVRPGPVLRGPREKRRRIELLRRHLLRRPAADHRPQRSARLVAHGQRARRGRRVARDVRRSQGEAQLSLRRRLPQSHGLAGNLARSKRPRASSKKPTTSARRTTARSWAAPPTAAIRPCGSRGFPTAAACARPSR